MKPYVIIDSRETRSKVPGILEKFCDVKYAPLTTGDYQVSDQIVIERKSYQDLEGSIISGRMFEQAERLSEYKYPIILIEGGANYGGPVYSRPKISKSQLHGALLSLITRYNCSIVHTANPTESANFIIQAAKRENKSGETIHIKTHKKGTTISEMRRQVFACFPGIGPKMAKELDSMPYPLIEILNAIDKCQIEKLGPKKRKAIQDVLQSC